MRTISNCRALLKFGKKSHIDNFAKGRPFLTLQMRSMRLRKKSTSKDKEINFEGASSYGIFGAGNNFLPDGLKLFPHFANPSFQRYHHSPAA